MKSYSLKNFLPELTSNIKITHRNDGLFLNPIITNQTMSGSLLKDFRINGDSYSDDVIKYRKGTEGTMFYDTNNFTIPSTDGYVMCPLWLSDIIPDRIIFTKSGIIVHTISMGIETKIGLYLRNHLSSLDNIDPIHINKERDQVSIYGIDIKNGSVSTLTQNISSQNINDLILRSVKDSNMIIQNLINLEFQIDTALSYDEYFYCVDREMFKYVPLIFTKNDFLPINYNKVIKNDEYDISRTIGKGLKLSNSSVAYPYCIDMNGKMVNVINVDGEDRLSGDIETSIKFYKNAKISHLPNKDNKNNVLYRLTKQFSQNDFVDVYMENNLSITLYADKLPNYVAQGNIFDAGDNMEYIFNPSGTMNQSIDAFIGAFNDTIGNELYLEATRVGDMILISGNGGSSNNVKLVHHKLQEMTIGIIDQHNTDSFMIPFEEFDEIKDEILFMQNNHGNYKIIGYRPYLLDIKEDEHGENFFNDIEKWYIITTKNVIGEKYFRYLAKPMLPSIGILSILDTKILSTTRSIKRLISKEEEISLFKPIKLEIGVEYVIVSKDTKIMHGGNIFSTDDAFTSISEDFNIISGSGLLIDSRYYGDPAMMQLLDVYNNDISNESEIVSGSEINWVQKYSSDSSGIHINTYENSIPKDELLPNIYGITNEWFIPSSKPKGTINSEKYFSELFDIDKYASDKTYFDNFVGENKSIFRRLNQDKPRCIFKGVEYVGAMDMDGYSLSVILNMHDQSDGDYFKGGLSYNMIKNEENKTSILLIDVAFSDYKIFDGQNKYFYYSLMYFLNDLRRSNDFNDFGIEYTYPYTQSITTDIEKFSGIRLPLKANSSGINGILFNNDIQVSNIIVPNQNGFVKVVIINKQTNTVISTDGLYGGGQQSKSILLENQHLNTLDGKLWVSCLNGLSVMSDMLISDLNNFVVWSSMEFYLLDGGYGGYTLQNQMLSYAFLRDTINNNRPILRKSIVDEYGSLYKNTKNDEIFNISDNTSNIFSGFYEIESTITKTFKGNLVNNCWNYCDDVSWNNINDKWQEIPDSIKLTSMENINT